MRRGKGQDILIVIGDGEFLGAIEGFLQAMNDIDLRLKDR